MSYEVRNEAIESVMKGIGHLIDDLLPEGWGFTLLLVETNKPEGTAFYISNVSREDSLKAMSDTVERMKKDLANLPKGVH